MTAPTKDELLAHVAVLTDALWDAYKASGADTDGDNDPKALIAGMGIEGFGRVVVREVERLSQDYQDSLDAGDGLAAALDALTEMKPARSVRDEMWKLYDKVKPSNSELAAQVIAMIAGLPEEPDEPYSEVRDLAGLVANSATRHNELADEVDEGFSLVADVLEDLTEGFETLVDVRNDQQRNHEVFLDIVKLHQAALERQQEVITKHEDTIGRLLLAVGTPEEATDEH